MTDCDDHEERLDVLERRFHQQDGVLAVLRVAALLVGIAIGLMTLAQVGGVTT